MGKLITFALIGFIAQLVDGALGMAYGVTSTSLLLVFGLLPSMVSATVHLAEVVTTAVSGISHIKFGNVDRQAVIKLIIPGSIGSFLGACFLSNLSGEIVKPYISLFLLFLGGFVLFRFFRMEHSKNERKSIYLSRMKSTLLGFIAGFADATGGGGWGPITTPVLLSQKGSSPRKVIGTVDTSEFAIAISATLGFLISLGWEGINWTWAITFMIGGIFAAPIAAWLVKRLPTYLLGVLVGGFIILTNIHTLLQIWMMSNFWKVFIYSCIVIGWVALIFLVIRKNKV
ncbi:sulfite exporter TauE/SafE family protein [Niallia endozanthoxylica]|uniref:Probable membrane transporter protein n=1 Tax=Niallia endozanthoxylica TaxID=2036016 RepID=A0A5J5GZ74_9BACI|nr:sulfite exporter TauE/SafE family protein [Niallia endozanthoxylica]KAA9013585.1 sulfite exporter TauE/SafE family protein [Niallia endozanthoxylica]